MNCGIFSGLVASIQYSVSLPSGKKIKMRSFCRHRTMPSRYWSIRTQGRKILEVCQTRDDVYKARCVSTIY